MRKILEKLGLGKYYEMFVEYNINYTTFKSLKEHNLRKLNLPRYASDLILNEIDNIKKEENESIHKYIFTNTYINIH